MDNATARPPYTREIMLANTLRLQREDAARHAAMMARQDAGQRTPNGVRMASHDADLAALLTADAAADAIA